MLVKIKIKKATGSLTTTTMLMVFQTNQTTLSSCTIVLTKAECVHTNGMAISVLLNM